VSYVPGNFSVTPAELTVTANGATRQYGLPNPPFTARYAGFANGDSFASLGGSLMFATAATPTSPIGSYSVTPSGLTSANYTISYVPGTLTIAPASTSTILTSSANPSAEGQAVTFTATVSPVSPGAAVPTGVVEFTDGAVSLGVVSLSSNQASITTTFVDGPTGHSITARFDGGGNFVISSASVTQTVLNVAPTVAGATWNVSVDPVKIGTSITGTITFADAGLIDTHVSTVNWGDGTQSSGTVTEAGGSGSVTATHTYNASGLYTVTFTVKDKDGGIGQTVFSFVAVYDPARSLTGSGSINSPAGAYVADPSRTGSASFPALAASYGKGATVPTGISSFSFSAAALNFSSSSYKWLVTSASNAWLRGNGNVTINGVNQKCEFLIAAVDGPSFTSDRYRIRIWNAGGVIYDDQLGGADNAVATVVTTTGPGSVTIK
jgi:hypothetical protein